ncbi:MAG: hypothetical protein ABJN84_03505 [Flavobacteriaceae bacterium]
MVKKTINILFVLMVHSMATNAQNPVGYTAEKSDNTAASLNLKNINGFWHLSGPRSYETNNNLSIFWNNGSYQRYLTLLDDGKVGIGSSNPLEKFQIGDSYLFHDGGHKVLFFMQGSGGVDLHADKYAAEVRFDPVNGSLKFGTSPTTTGAPISRLSIFKDGTTYFNGDKVGIGTSNLQEKFQIGDSYLFHDGGHKVLFFMQGSGGVDLHPDKYAAEVRFDPVNGYLRFGTSPTTTDVPITTFSISKDGKVGIGSLNTGSHRLAVEGSIGAREVKVEASGWSDYVFKEGYDLPTLEEVEKHIQEKGHLINIPSDQEVEEKGIQLGEMNKLLLEKIEELTLYTLEQQKQLKLQKEKNKSLEERLHQLEIHLINNKK